MTILAYLGKNWIAVAALIISAFLLYSDHLEPFRLEVRSAGRITIARNPFAAGLRQDSILLDVIFSNAGARRGVVEDLAIDVRGRDQRVIFRSLAVDHDRNLNLTKELPPPRLETFIGFQLGKEESVIRRVLLVPGQGDAFTFNAETYAADIWVVSTGTNDWLRYGSLTFTVDRDDIDVLARTSATPRAAGGVFVTLPMRDKVLDESEERFSRLKTRLLHSGRK